MAVATGSRPPRPAVIRKLGHLENYHQAWHTLRHLLGVVIACRYALPTSAAVQAEDHARALFEHAVAQTVLDHPMLRVAIVDAEAKKSSWVRVDSLDLAAHMDWQTLNCTSEQDYEDRLQAIIDHHHDTDFPHLDTRPGWRMTLLRRRIVALDDKGTAGAELEPFVECVFAWNHSHFDGMSAKMFHETLLANLNKVTASEENMAQIPLQGHLLDLSTFPLTKDNFTPNLHDITKLPVTPGFTVKTAWKELKPPKKQSSSTSTRTASPQRDSHGAAWAPIVASSYKTHTLRSHSLDGPALAKILALCRKQEGGGITLTALVHALCLSSLVSLFPRTQSANAGALKPDSFEAATAINFRRFLKPNPPGYPSLDPGRTMANYVTGMDHKFGPGIVSEMRETDPPAAADTTSDAKLTDAARKAIWKAAAQIKHDLDARMERGNKNDQTGLMGLVGDWRAQHTANTKKPRHTAWNLSNLGVIDGGSTDEASWAVTKCWFTVGAMVCGGVFMITPVAVKGQGLFIGCTWQDGVLDKQFAEKFFARLIDRLRELVAE
ncbi:hypothetical protein Micbo1qcDRAFT_191797 [Microdochium bolleyi]|uniref:Alcohol acetyltransferase n=1 Tax=Microdochium bolleyi TaxID=196109 RepID=A0A136JJF3_9PEZI|nr:hypothetical protein Micbo1qcDRAFT_191797 [Microdochium bolleyi]